MIEQPTMVKICDIREESAGVKTFFFKWNMNFAPGQFVMIWIPALDEKPFTISYMQGEICGISVLKRGVFTNALHEKKTGDVVGIRGPYGRGFSVQINSKTGNSNPAGVSNINLCIVGGGIGMASLAILADRLQEEIRRNQSIFRRRGSETTPPLQAEDLLKEDTSAHYGVTIIQGARTVSELLYQERFKDMRLCTDDGSAGFKGTAVALLNEQLKERRFQKVYACGPEGMLRKVVEICKKYSMECEVSVERYMKCGFGVCGQCDCSGRRVCVEGPVFNIGELKTMEDFGKVIITKTGERIAL